MFDANWATLWEAVAAAVPERPAIFHGETTLSYRDLEARAARLAAGLDAAGVGAGAKVACYLYNCPEYLETVFAALKLDAVPVNVNYRYRAQELVGLLADADAEVLVFHASLAGNVREALGHLPTLRLAIQVDDAKGAPVPPLEGAVTWADAHAAVGLPPRERSGDAQLFMYTGGTTGMPKGVVWRQRDLFEVQRYPTYGVLGLEYPESVEEVAAHAVAIGERAPRSLPVTPLMHATALFTVMDGMLLGAAVVFAPTRRLDPAAVWGAVQRYRVNRLIVAGNAVAGPLADELDRAAAAGAPYDLSSVTSMVSSGVAWTDDVKARLLAHREMQLTEILASSEGGPFAYAVVNRLEDLPSRFRPAPGSHVLDDQGREVTPGSGRVGTLAFTGGMPLGYYKDPERTAAVYREIGGRRHVMPGDLVTVDADGSYRFLGRASGVINTGGEKVYPAEVEGVLMEHPAVADCVVFGLPDDRWGHRVAAMVASVPGRTVTEQELADHVGARLAGYKKPRAVVLVDSLGRGPNGKLNMQAVRERAQAALARTG
jgi:3-oxocholest-4-en-26-oate---CoA ligase